MEFSLKKNQTEQVIKRLNSPSISRKNKNLMLAKESSEVDSPLLINPMKDGERQKLSENVNNEPSELQSFRHKLKKL